jgi:hypothetical protein
LHRLTLETFRQAEHVAVVSFPEGQPLIAHRSRNDVNNVDPDLQHVALGQNEQLPHNLPRLLF